MNKLLLLWIFLYVSSSTIATMPALISKVKTDKSYVEPTLSPKSIYSIDIERTSTNKEDESNKCRIQQKEIVSLNQFEKFRIGGDKKRESSVFESLTVLPDRENGLESFRVLGDKIILILMNGTALFLNNSKEIENSPKPVELNIQLSTNEYKFTPIIAPLGNNAFVATPRDVSYCEPALNKCTKITGFKGVDLLFNFAAFEVRNKKYLAFLSGETVTMYEVSVNGVAFDERVYDASFFGRKIFIEDIALVENNKVLFLDFYTGLIEVEHEGSSVTELKNGSKTVYQQFGCKHLSHQNEGRFVTLDCTLTQKTYFILQLTRATTLENFTAQKPIFFNEALTGIDSSSEIILANIFSGVKLYWASSNLESPYPYDFQKAGSIFLHNAKGSQFSILDNRKVIYIFTEDELRIYDITVKNPEIVCYSLVPIKEEYKIEYTYLCDKESLLHLKICTVEKKLSYEAWEHKEINIKGTLIPLFISFLLVVGVGILLAQLSTKYNREIESARLKYNSNEDFEIGEN